MVITGANNQPGQGCGVDFLKKDWTSIGDVTLQDTCDVRIRLAGLASLDIMIEIGEDLIAAMSSEVIGVADGDPITDLERLVRAMPCVKRAEGLTLNQAKRAVTLARFAETGRLAVHGHDLTLHEAEYLCGIRTSEGLLKAGWGA